MVNVVPLLAIAGAGALASVTAAATAWLQKRRSQFVRPQSFTIRKTLVVNGKEEEITIMVKGQPDLEGLDKLLEIAKDSAHQKYAEVTAAQAEHPPATARSGSR